MAKTYLDQLVEFPSKVMRRISDDKYCVGLLADRSFNEVVDDDKDDVLDKYLFDYQYVDNTTTETCAYIWSEIEVDDVSNKQIKGVRLYVTVACHKNFMKLDGKVFPGVMGNRRDNIVRYVDRLLNSSAAVGGIGELSLQSVRTLSPVGRFTIRELTYRIPDFNIVELTES